MRRIHQIFIILVVFLGFLYIFISFIITFYIKPNNFEIPLLLFIGFAILIFISFYLFIFSKSNDKNRKILSFRFFNERTIKILLLILYFLTSIIPSISFSDTIIDWNNIGVVNYIRAIIMLIVSSFLPGACFYNIFFYRHRLHKRFNVEPFFFKLLIYPLLSLTLLGSYTLILDQLGLIRSYFSILITMIIIIIFFIDFLIEIIRKRKKSIKEVTENKIKISKYTFLIFIIAIGTIIIALSIHLSVKYLIPGDNYVGISYAEYIGRIDTKYTDKFYTYTIIWGYISFNLSILSGLPYININALLFPYVYLFIFSLYLLCKTLLKRFKPIYSVFATLLISTFSGLFYLYNPNLGRSYISALIFDGIINFRYKSFAISLFITSIAFFISAVNDSYFTDSKYKEKKKNLITIILGTWFIFQSTALYFLPFIPAYSLYFIFCLFSKNKVESLKFFLKSFLIFIILFILFDFLMSFLYSWKIVAYLSLFLDVNRPILKTALIYNAIFVYLIFISGFILVLLYYKIYKKFFSNRFKKYYRINSKIILCIIIGIIIVLFGVEIIYNLILKKEMTFFWFYLDLLFINLGFIGILGFISLYVCFKVNKILFYRLALWFLFILVYASIFIFIRFINYPFKNILELPENDYLSMMYWFDRLWYYSIIPISIFSSIGIIRLKKYLNSRILKFNKSKYSISIFRLGLIFFMIFFTFSNTIIAGLAWYNIGHKLTDDDAQIIGWTSEYIPRGSNILIDKHNLKNQVDRITFCSTYFIHLEVEDAISNQNLYNWDTDKQIDSNCNIKLLREFDGYENVTQFSDHSNLGLSSIKISFNENRINGYVDFSLKITNATKTLSIDFLSDNKNIGISLVSRLNALYYYNGLNYSKIEDISNNLWYHVKILFESSEENYMGLMQYQWKTIINEKEYGNYFFCNNVSNIKNMKFYTNINESDYMVYFSDIIFSWALDFNIIKCIFKYIIIIEHLKLKNINYFIHTLEDNYYKRIVEKIIDIENELILYFYNIKLYSYGKLIIYCIS